MENNREHYFGLSLKECEALYKIKLESFNREWRDPLKKMLKKHIVDRIKVVDGSTEGDTWQVDLPFHIPIKDEYGQQQWWSFMETPGDVRVGDIILTRYDDRRDECVEYLVEDLEKLQILIMWLDRMGFWDDEEKRRFQVL